MSAHSVDLVHKLAIMVAAIPPRPLSVIDILICGSGGCWETNDNCSFLIILPPARSSTIPPLLPSYWEFSVWFLSGYTISMLIIFVGCLVPRSRWFDHD